MTEELKQKAEEYIKKLGYTEENLPNDEHRQMLDAYIAGATENGVQWHEVADGDLPKDRHNVLVVYLNGEYQRERTFASYRHKYWVISGHKTECEVIAWCEIPQFKE